MGAWSFGRMGRSVAARWGAPAPRERLAWLCTALVVVLCIAEFCAPIEQADDAFISYRYALNLAHGHGLVFNPGEYVEGFTNLLWTPLIAAWIKLGVHAPAASQIMSVTFAAVSLVLAHVYARRFLPQRLAWMAALAPVVLYASNSFASWMTTGLETPLFLALTIAALLEFDRGRMFATAGYCVLALLCRPEGGIEAFALLGLPWLAALWRGPRTPRAILGRSGPALLFAAALALLTAWRLYYYGDWVPNTFHAKVGQAGMALGWIYVLKFFWEGAALLLPGFAVAAFAVPKLRGPAAFVVLTLAYVVYIGGDVFNHGRFMLPTLPVLVTAAIAAAAWALARSVVLGAGLLLLVPATAVASLYIYVPLPVAAFAGFDEFRQAPDRPFPWSGKRAEGDRHYMFHNEKRVALVLAGKMRAAKPGAKLIACIGIGKMGYYNMDFDLLDMVGLTDRHVAESQRSVPDTFVMPGHSRTDSDYVLSRRPDIIILPRNTEHRPVRLPAEVDMLTNPKLPQNYVFDDNGGFWVRK
jgi:hypothetical protein